MDRLTAEQRHRNMQNIKSKDTKIEQLLRKELWRRGYRYKKNSSALIGKPDMVFPKYKTVVFCDSEFFHGKNWNKLKKQLEKSERHDFWTDKIKKNRERDRKVNRQLRAEGWTVIRFWGKDILRSPEACADKFEKAILKKTGGH